MRVLFADGDSEFLDIAKRFMKQCGHEALVTSNGLECIRSLRDRLPDVLVLSRELLWGGSEGVLEIIDEEPKMEAIPVIFITDEKRESKEDTGVIDKIEKPYLLAQLLKQMQTCEVSRLRSLV